MHAHTRTSRTRALLCRLLEVAQASLSGVGSSTEEDLLEKAVAAGDDVLYPYLGDGRLKIGDRIRLGEEEEVSSHTRTHFCHVTPRCHTIA